MRGSLLASALLGEEEQLALDALELLCVSTKQRRTAHTARHSTLWQLGHTNPAGSARDQTLRLLRASLPALGGSTLP